MKVFFKVVRKILGFLKDVFVVELFRELSFIKEEELLFLQLLDIFFGQLFIQDIKFIKIEVQGEDGQMVFIKQEKDWEVKLVENVCILVDLIEGQVGKLFICKFGRV